MLARWLSDYRPRAAAAAAVLGELFQEAMRLWDFDATGNSQKISESREFLKQKRSGFPYRVVFFIYSSQFDEVVESRILDSDELRAAASASGKVSYLGLVLALTRTILAGLSRRSREDVVMP